MRTITQEELNQILADHALWLDDDPAGVHADLSRTNLIDVELGDASLSYINLTGVDLTGVDLTDADLSGADLTGANLTDADLADADFYHANLTDTTLTDANLVDANLAGAKFGLNIIDAASIYHATFSKDTLMWLIPRDDWAKVKDTVKIVNN